MTVVCSENVVNDPMCQQDGGLALWQHRSGTAVMTILACVVG